MNDWYIDALDTRAGLAIASRRPRDSLNALKEDGPIAFIGPPAFAPEFVSSRATAFAMARGHAQLGLFDEEGEVPFDSLDAVAEFVRRTYLRGAGGDGPAGGGGPGPVEPGPESPRGGESDRLRPFEPRGGGDDYADPIAALATFAGVLGDTSSKLDRGGSAEPKFNLGALRQVSEDDRRTAARRIARGALHILRELHRSGPSDRPPDGDLDWFNCCGRLIAEINRLGVWRFLSEEFTSPDDVVQWFGARPRQHRDLVDLTSYIFDRYDFPYRYWEDGVWSIGLDKVDLFERLPVPKDLALPPHDQPNLLAILSAAIAHPNAYFSDKKSSLGQTRAEIVLFAAAILNADSYHPINWWHTDLDLLFASRAAARGHAWLARNLPKRVFARDVENLIGSAATVPA